MKLASTVAVVLLAVVGCQAFSVRDMEERRMASNRLMLRSQLEGSTVEEEDDTRRAFMLKVPRAILLGGLMQGAMLPALPGPAQAVSGIQKVNAKLTGYGLPQVDAVPSGFSPLLEIYGKGKNRETLLVYFAHPLTWVVTLPSNDANGEDGTVQAGEYAKGDTATLYVYTDPGHVSDITKAPKDLFEKALMKSIGQKGNNMYQNFKVTKLVPSDNGKYMTADFKYQLLTGAGFEVDRKGVASITSEGNGVQVLWTASTAPRFKKTEEDLRNIAASFRCYSEGLNLSDEFYEAGV